MLTRRIIQRVNRAVKRTVDENTPDYKNGIVKPLSTREKEEYTLYLMSSIVERLNDIAKTINEQELSRTIESKNE